MYLRVCQYEQGVRIWCIDYCINPAIDPDSCTRFLGPIPVEASLSDKCKFGESNEFLAVKRIAEFYNLNIIGRENETLYQVERRLGGTWDCLSEELDTETAAEYFLYGSQDRIPMGGKI